ncbi:hypothetical protein [Kitasatospora sp. NPDC087315]|uniref:hypothetical protein n=1 Tax=Kitasatospora sp. NPDC087315 TaxID=3364069 RepID=UPI00381259FF
MPYAVLSRRPAEFSDASIGPITHHTEQPVEPLTISWDRQVDTPHDPAKPTVVHCVTTDGRPVLLLLDEELREALGLALVDPSLPDVETDQPGPHRARRRFAPRRHVRIR